MMKTLTKPYRLRLCCVALAMAGAAGLLAEGIPEPDLIFYGTVRDGGTGARLTSGRLEWVLQPSAGGAAVMVSTELANINDQFSYVLRVPCEFRLGGTAVSPNTLQLAGSPTSYDRSQVTIDGMDATFVEPSLTALVLTRADRGSLERIDLQVMEPFIDSDGNGLPDDWEMAHFGHIGVDPDGDADGDGMTNKEEWKAGTDPNDPTSAFSFIHVGPHPEGGVLVEWSSVEGKTYALLRSLDLMSGFSAIATGIAATAPSNSHRDAGAIEAGPYFYRLLLEE